MNEKKYVFLISFNYIYVLLIFSDNIVYYCELQYVILIRRRLLNNLCTTTKCNIGVTNQFIIQTRDYAARKGTRARREAKKIKRKVEKIEKLGFMERKLRERQMQSNKPILKKAVDYDKYKSISKDNVWILRYHRCKIYTVEDAVQSYREAHHPTMLNCPNSQVDVKIELNLETEKKGKFISAFNRIVNYPHYFDHGEIRNIMVFSSKAQVIEQVLKAGATLAGGRDLIKSIKAGDLSLNDYQYCLAEPDILAELILIRGLLKKKFPTSKTGTLSPDLESLVKKFVLGVKYDAIPDKLEKHYGLIKCPIGTLNMDSKHLEENFAALINDVNSVKSKKHTNFIIRTQLLSPPSKEYFVVDFTKYLPETISKKDPNQEEEDEEDISYAVIPSQ
ncbi:50S ribosomal protein L1-like isoform X1 [Vespa mandarinia]|uniref:50S ribosomal protein L1-like isoform X1 n=1 Tax=Vespa mandarinia TaxID=7446 RepID=UPI00161BCD1C|nr:50S ribosomal protein L1-like isoform X1 [Vespa mandarinia]